MLQKQIEREEEQRTTEKGKQPSNEQQDSLNKGDPNTSADQSGEVDG